MEATIELGDEEASQPVDSKPNRVKKRMKFLKDDETVDSANGGSAKKEGRWQKYANKYKPQWETLEIFANWLQRTPENLIQSGKPEAYCVYCHQCLRAHKSDLVAHAKSKKHTEAASNPPTTGDCRSFLESYVPYNDDSIDDAAIELTNDGSSDPPNKRKKGKQPKPIRNKEGIIRQITAEMEETNEKIQACEEELESLRIKKTRLVFELDYYNNH